MLPEIFRRAMFSYCCPAYNWNKQNEKNRVLGCICAHISYLSVKEVPRNIESLRVSGEDIFLVSLKPKDQSGVLIHDLQLLNQAA